VTLGQLFDELKRRNVFRVGVAYVVSAWLVLQVVDVVINNIGAPDWVFSVFILAGTVFFVPVLIFAWAYELTPEGLKRETEVDRSHSITHRTGRKLDLITIGMLVLVVAFVMIERTWLSQPVEVASDASVDTTSDVMAATANEKSIAVLAFDDLSPEGDQAFFVEGLSEEILNVLAQVPGLKVAGRTSSFAFKGKHADLREIGEALNVAHILEGSVRKAGNRIRVTAQLIQASDGFHLFSQTYDRDLTDVFAVQDDLAALIGKALHAEVTGEDNIPTVAQTSIEAYDLYLLARQRIHSRSPELMSEAIGLLDQALEIDPDYAPALAQKALALILMSDGPGAYGDIPEAVANAEGLKLIARALELDPELAEAHAILGLINTDQPGMYDDAVASLRYALELNPNMDNGKNWLANLTLDFAEAVDLYEQVVLRDPLHGAAFNNLVLAYLDLAQYDKVEALITRTSRISGPDANIRQALGSAAVMRGDLSTAIRDFGYAIDVNQHDSVAKLWLAWSLFRLGDMERAEEVGRPGQVLIVRAFQGEFDAVDRMIAEADFRSGERLGLFQGASAYLLWRGRSADIIDIVDDEFGGLDELLKELPASGFFGTNYLGTLAKAYREEGMTEEFDTTIQAMQSVLETQRARGSDTWVHWVSQAEYAALTGDVEAAVGHLQTALDKGFSSVVPPLGAFDSLEDDPRFEAILATSLERANRERVELGMGPYERPLLLE
jgi:TolB-like protein/Tfp pilus assembly protein PilF